MGKFWEARKKRENDKRSNQQGYGFRCQILNFFSWILANLGIWVGGWVGGSWWLWWGEGEGKEGLGGVAKYSAMVLCHAWIVALL